MKLFERLLHAKATLDPVQSDYRVVFEADLDSPCAILVPDPNWMACALHGDILPPVEVYEQLEIVEGKVTNGHILHEHTIGAMTEEDALMYLVRKDCGSVYESMWKGNRPLFNITKKQNIPANRMHRNAWEMNLDHDKPIMVDFDKAKHLQKKKTINFFIENKRRVDEIMPLISFDEDLDKEFTMRKSMDPEKIMGRLDRAKTLADLDTAVPAPVLLGFDAA